MKHVAWLRSLEYHLIESRMNANMDLRTYGMSHCERFSLGQLIGDSNRLTHLH